MSGESTEPSPAARMIVNRLMQMHDRFEKAGPTHEAIMAMIDEHHGDALGDRRELLSEIMLLVLEEFER